MIEAVELEMDVVNGRSTREKKEVRLRLLVVMVEARVKREGEGSEVFNVMNQYQKVGLDNDIKKVTRSHDRTTNNRDALNVLKH